MCFFNFFFIKVWVHCFVDFFVDILVLSVDVKMANADGSSDADFDNKLDDLWNEGKQDWTMIAKVFPITQGLGQ